MIMQLAVLLATMAMQSPSVGGVQIANYGGVPIDLELGKERAEGGNWAVNDCSTTAVQCLSGYYYRLAMPRNCAGIRVGDTFRGGPVQTDVLWKGPREAANYPLFNGPITIVGSSDRRWIVYVYSATTLSAIYVDPNHALDLYGAAKQSGLQGLRALEAAPDRLLLPLNSFRGVMECPTRPSH
ncbi:hypothetical protein [uncultured Brevundimonas sp.]|uniref:hypothetical protein n=1 Tax=uncultured Brevundimonas sp. TaxID=213418 RepID=UPI00260122A6|nr:hypothetical protein [uncultured Brevundimonas sp.]